MTLSSAAALELCRHTPGSPFARTIYCKTTKTLTIRCPIADWKEDMFHSSKE